MDWVSYGFKKYMEKNIFFSIVWRWNMYFAILGGMLHALSVTHLESQWCHRTLLFDGSSNI